MLACLKVLKESLKSDHLNGLHSNNSAWDHFSTPSAHIPLRLIHSGYSYSDSSSPLLSINQSVKIYIAPLQDTCAYSEALPTKAKRKRTVFRRWWNWEQAPFGRCLRWYINQQSRVYRRCLKLNTLETTFYCNLKTVNHGWIVFPVDDLEG